MKTTNLEGSRRTFLKTMVPAGGMICFGCPNLFSANLALGKDQEFLEKITTELSISHENLFKSRYEYFILRMDKFAEYLGRDKLLSMLKRAVDDINLTKKPNLEATSVRDFIQPVLDSKNQRIRTDIEIIELTDKVCEAKITNCLWAKTFRDMNAGDIGYANTCHGDFSSATAYNPKLKLKRTKTLMEGHDCCDHIYTWDR